MVKAAFKKSINIKIAEEVFQVNSDNPGIFIRFVKFHRDFLTTQGPKFKINLSHKKSKKNLFSYLIEYKAKRLTVRLENERLLNNSLYTKRLDVYAHKTFDLENFFRILLSYYLSEHEGLFLHASCVEHRGFAHIFCGPSGAGKSTIAGLAGNRRVLSDDLILIRKANKEFRAFATPFGLHSSNTASINLPIKALYLLQKAKNIRLQKPPFQHVMMKLISNLVFLGDHTLRFKHLFNRFFMNSHGFLSQIPCYQLDFSINRNLWRYL